MLQNYEDNLIQIGGNEIELDAEILDAIEIGKTIIVLKSCNTLSGEVDCNNVVAFDHDGNRLWQVEKPDREIGSNPSCYSEIIVEDGTLYGYNWNTYKYAVDISDGTIREIGKTGK